MNFNEYMKIPENRIDGMLLKKIKCLDGVEISVQASHYLPEHQKLKDAVLQSIVDAVYS